MDLRIELDTREFDKKLGKLPKQIPFAVSRALNATAADAVTVLKASLDEDFTVRTSWLQKGIRFDPANKQNLRAIVGSVDYFMEEQALGGQRDAKTDHGIAVPMTGRGLPRAKETSVTRRSKWAGALLDKRDAFIGDPFGSGTPGLWERVKVGRGKNARSGLRLLYSFPDDVQIDPRWKLEDHVREVVRERWADHTASAIQEAIDTAR